MGELTSTELKSRIPAGQSTLLFRQLLNVGGEKSPAYLQAKTLLAGYCIIDFPAVLGELSRDALANSEVRELADLALRKTRQPNFPEGLGYYQTLLQDLKPLKLNDAKNKRAFIDTVRRKLRDIEAPREAQIQNILMALGIAPYYSWQQIEDMIKDAG